MFTLLCGALKDFMKAFILIQLPEMHWAGRVNLLKNYKF